MKNNTSFYTSKYFRNPLENVPLILYTNIVFMYIVQKFLGPQWRFRFLQECIRETQFPPLTLSFGWEVIVNTVMTFI